MVEVCLPLTTDYDVSSAGFFWWQTFRLRFWVLRSYLTLNSWLISSITVFYAA
ncbi:uncharacterized protein DEA37_0008230 [Paragonimus westermani]|uniref:Uncharacterized protein n=1 Tax=Paragonimus westermani TaxID=34504 RepID=A0A5J4N5X0_9TREM|nr:uncharacterized protein DEA37_0008230 [Paragonimus westermani]